MRFRSCFRQCSGKIPLKLNGRPHFCRRSTVLAFCGSPCRVCAGRKPGRSPIAPPGRSWRPLATVSRPPGGWGCALPSPQARQKGPATSPGRPLQTAGFSPQGSRPADGFGGRWPPAAPPCGRLPCGPASGTNLSHRHPPQHRLQLPALQRRCQRRPGQGKLRRQTGRLF